jgi:hypothetical protein
MCTKDLLKRRIIFLRGQAFVFYGGNFCEMCATIYKRLNTDTIYPKNAILFAGQTHLNLVLNTCGLI